MPYEVKPRSTETDDEWVLYRTGDGGFDRVGTFPDHDDAEFCRAALEGRERGRQCPKSPTGRHQYFQMDPRYCFFCDREAV